MTSWIKKRKPSRKKLEVLVSIAKAGVNSLGHGELQELSLLYRQTAADLAAVREYPGYAHFARYLIQLMVRAHNIIYSGHRANPWSMVRFFRQEYPRLFRRNLKYCGACDGRFCHRRLDRHSFNPSGFRFPATRAPSPPRSKHSTKTDVDAFDSLREAERFEQDYDQ